MFKASKHTAPKTADLLVASTKPVATSVSEAQANNMAAYETAKSEGFVLIGKGTKIGGEIIDSTILDIQGEFEGDVEANSVIVREGASFKGSMQTQFVEVYGLIEGTLIAEELLDIRPTGLVNAEVRYGELSVATGACLTGSIQSTDKTGLNNKDEKSIVENSVMDGINAHHITIN